MLRIRVSGLAAGGLAVLILAGVPTAAAAQDRVTVAVLDFHEQAGVEPGTGALLADLVRGELYLSKHVALVDRANIDRIISEQRLALGGLTESAELTAQVGKLLGVPFVWTGSVGRLGRTFLITLRTINVSTAEVERFTQIKGRSLDELAGALPRATRELLAGDPYRTQRLVQEGQALIASGRYAEAVRAFEEAVALSPEDPDARRHLDRARALVRSPQQPPPRARAPEPFSPPPVYVSPGSIEGLGLGAEPARPWWDPPTSQQHYAAAAGLSVAITSGLGQRFTLIPPGTFLMGSARTERAREDDEEPRHPIELPYAFYMAATEVTNAVYDAFLEDAGYEGNAHADPDYLRHHRDWRQTASPGERYPVVGVSWYNAVQFCRWLTETERSAGRLGPYEEYRLPTEAEWEYACRAGSNAAWSYGIESRNLGRYAAFKGNSRGTRTTGRRRPNAWGLFDLHGNVQEWCQSLKRPYPYRADDGRENLSEASKRTVRGGGWKDAGRYTRSAHRLGDFPRRASIDRGFRFIRVVALAP